MVLPQPPAAAPLAHTRPTLLPHPDGVRVTNLMVLPRAQPPAAPLTHTYPTRPTLLPHSDGVRVTNLMVLCHGIGGLGYTQCTRGLAAGLILLSSTPCAADMTDRKVANTEPWPW